MQDIFYLVSRNNRRCCGASFFWLARGVWNPTGPDSQLQIFRHYPQMLYLRHLSPNLESPSLAIEAWLRAAPTAPRILKVVRR